MATVTSSDRLDNGAPAMVLIWMFVCGYTWEIVTDLHKGHVMKWTLYNALTNACFLVSLFASLLDQCAGHPRESLAGHCPILVAEAFFAVGVTLSFGRIFYFAQLISAIGPLLHAVSHVATVMMLSLCVVMVILFAFATGMSGLYGYYEDTESTDSAGNVLTQPDSFLK